MSFQRFPLDGFRLHPDNAGADGNVMYRSFSRRGCTTGAPGPIFSTPADPEIEDVPMVRDPRPRIRESRPTPTPVGSGPVTLSGRSLEWRRRMVLRGPLPCEILHDDAVVGQIRPVRSGLTRAEYVARWDRGGEWRFRGHGLWFAGRTGEALSMASDDDPAPVLASRRVRFRHRQLSVTGGSRFSWRQRGFAGTRYELTGPDNATLLEARNTGGALRWSGAIRAYPAAGAYEPLLPLLVLYAVFLVFTSSEIQL